MTRRRRRRHLPRTAQTAGSGRGSGRPAPRWRRRLQGKAGQRCCQRGMPAPLRASWVAAGGTGAAASLALGLTPRLHRSGRC